MSSVFLIVLAKKPKSSCDLPGYSIKLSDTLHPAGSDELKSMLRSAADRGHSIQLFGGNSKRLMAGPIAPAETRISTAAMKRILQYEPRDLTISVEAGLPYMELSRALARNGQMIPLAGPYSPEATIGGLVASNISESRRRGYGTARDLVIGMEFATLEGKLVRSGGMVVKNVAGLDMGKLMIGAFGTLAAIATLNFKLLPIPMVSGTLLFPFEDLKAAWTLYEAVMKAGLNPLAADVMNPILSAQFSLKNFILALQFGGNQAVIERSVRESMAFSTDPETVRHLSSEEEQRFWSGIAAITPRHLEKFRDGVVARVSTPVSESFNALAAVEGAGHIMAASGVARAWFSRPDAASRWLQTCRKRGWKGVIEFGGENVDRGSLALWPAPGADFEIMKGVKKMFDPDGLLNRGRLFNLI